MVGAVQKVDRLGEGGDGVLACLLELGALGPGGPALTAERVLAAAVKQLPERATSW